MRLLQLVTFEMDPGMGKVSVRDACAPRIPGELEDPVGVDHGATQVAPERLEQGELSLTVGASGTFVRDAGRGGPTSECVSSLLQPSREQLQGT